MDGFEDERWGLAESYGEEEDGYGGYAGEFEDEPGEAVRRRSHRRVRVAADRPPYFAPPTSTPTARIQRGFQNVQQDMRRTAAVVDNVDRRVASVDTRANREIAKLRDDVQNASLLGAAVTLFQKQAVSFDELLPLLVPVALLFLTEPRRPSQGPQGLLRGNTVPLVILAVIAFQKFNAGQSASSGSNGGG